MRRIARSGCLWAAALLAALPPGEADEVPPGPASVEQFLRDWEDHASSITFLDAHFSRTDVSKAWGDSRYRGRLVLGMPNQAAVEFTKIEEEGRPAILEERVVWAEQSLTQYASQQQSVFRFRQARPQPRPPEIACLPFFFNMTAEQAAARYNWRFLKQDDGLSLIEIRAKGGGLINETYERCFVWLDRQTFLPSRFRLDPVEGKGDRQEFLLTGLVLNQPCEIPALGATVPPGWALREWDEAHLPRWARGFFKASLSD